MRERPKVPGHNPCHPCFSFTSPILRVLLSADMRPACVPSYSEWRLESGFVPLLRDSGDCPPEKLLQAVWQHQRVLRDRLATLDGRPLRVLHPGFQNHSGGPDFRDAVIQFGDSEPVVGDVEVDLRSSGWRAHGHHSNPAFSRVVLHVVWEPGQPGHLATLCLSGSLDAPIGELSLWLATETNPAFPEEYAGRCSAHLKNWEAGKLEGLLHLAARSRLDAKASQFRARARQSGWEQVLWEAAFRALGYRHNSWPMQRLGELRERWCEPEGEPVHFQARLFGLGGLLPGDLRPGSADNGRYLLRLWDQWWRERDRFGDVMLPTHLWQFRGQRPANHPHRRLALASHWAARGDLAKRVEAWCARELSDSDLATSLWEELRVPSDPFWDWHSTLRSSRLSRPQPLLGQTRVTELAVNVILPWLWARALEGRNYPLQARIEKRYYAWPSGEDNSVLRQARLRLLGNLPARGLRGAAAQQGLLQIVRDFCDHSTSLCTDCKFPSFIG